MKLLVAGGDRVDAGKTTFAAGLVAYLRRERDATPRAFKPRAGNDYWFDHDDVLAAVADGRLYGKDARTLAAAESAARSPEALNPLHRLWRPTPGQSGLLGEPDRTFLVDRLTTADGDAFVVNAEADVPAVVRESLPLSGATRVDSVEGFNDLMAERYLPAFERLTGTVQSSATAVVESYGDIASPLSGVDYDAVAVVDPGRARIYEGPRWLRACEVARGSPREGQLEERVGPVVEMLDPVARVSLRALSNEARTDPETIADAYARAYEELVQAV
ncbi:MAG: ATPase [Haloferacaceae archaeon]